MSVFPGTWGCLPCPCMNQSWPGTEAVLMLLSAACPGPKRGKLLRNSQKGQWVLGDLLTGGPKRVRLEELQPSATKAPCSPGAISVPNRERGPCRSLPCPTPNLKVLVEKEGLKTASASIQVGVCFTHSNA